MKFFQKIVNKLFLFCKNPQKNIKENNNSIIPKCSISLLLDKNDKKHVQVEYQTLHENSSSLMSLSEQFAEMIAYLGSSEFNKLLFHQLLDKQKQSEDVEEQIFIDNAMTFYYIIKQKTAASNKSRQPVIRPLSVFNTK